MGAQIAVDIGGTFTDVALAISGRTHVHKLLTTHQAPERGFIDGVRVVLATAGLSASDISSVFHGTTLATNAIIERRGARVALVTTSGFRDVIEIADEGRFDQYDLQLRKPPPLVPRALRFTVRERVDSNGHVLLPLDPEEIDAVAEQIRCCGAEAIAVGFIHAYRNPLHERQVRDRLERLLPGLPISISSDVCPEIREYERISTTCANAYVMPVMEGYLTRLAAQLRELGVPCGVLLMTSGGGLCSLDLARRYPIRLVESGPAGGAALGSQIARQCALEQVLSFDMGGTTAKICLIDQFKAEMARSFEVARSARFKKGSGLPLRIPVIELIEIGAGGGSLARVNSLGNLEVGPESAGSDPGPACYGRGGEVPSVTDADLLLGRIAAEGFAGGTMKLDVTRSRSVIETHAASPLHLDADLAAYGIAETVDEMMTNAARVYAIERGKDLEKHAMIAFGGAAPLHAARMAEKLHIDRVLIPPNAGVGSAIGFLCAPIAFESIRSRFMLLSEFAADALNTVFAELTNEVGEAVRGTNVDMPLHEERHANMRYRGQGHEISVPLPSRVYASADREEFRRRFNHRYCELFGRNLPGAEVEILTLGVRLSGQALANLDEVRNRRQHDDGAELPVAMVGRRRVFLTGSDGFREVPVLDRAAMQPGEIWPGPCVVTEQTTTTFIPAAFETHVDKHDNLWLHRRART